MTPDDPLPEGYTLQHNGIAYFTIDQHGIAGPPHLTEAGARLSAVARHYASLSYQALILARYAEREEQRRRGRS